LDAVQESRADTGDAERAMLVRSRVTAWAVGAAMTVAFIATFLLRFQTAAFINDHFTHLSRAREIVHGEWPIRDFFDPGQFLHYYVSAAAQVVFGYNLLGEALVTAFFIAVAAAITYGVSYRFSRSHAIAAGATALAVIAFPRLYNYPKVFLYAAAVWLAWWYAWHPTRWRILLLAAFTALSFLFRYDHGAYVAIYMLIVQGLTHAAQPRKWLAVSGTYLGLCCLLLIPFALYVQWAAGLRAYVTASVTPAQLVERRVQSRNRLTFSSLDDWTTAATTALNHEPDKTDRVRRFEETFHHEALSSFYAITVVLPFVALVMAGLAWWRGSIERPEAVTMVATACFCLVLWRTMMVDNPDARLADVASPTAILGAWIFSRCLAPVRTGAWRGSRGLLLRAGVAAAFAFTLWSVSMQASFLSTLERYQIAAPPSRMAQEFVNTYRRLQLRPIYEWAPSGDSRGIRALTRYVMRCTEPTDRLLIAGEFAPDVYFYSERLFAGGMVHFMRPWHMSMPEQRTTIARLQRQRIPIAIVGDADRFQRDFSFVSDYVRTRFVEVAYSGFDDETQLWHVLVDRQLAPVRADSQMGLPCYRTSPGE